ncbi:MAG: hypothetical protein QF554_07445 [Dehalococcoidia bacterium]|jgi:hypothetical protein|nr:hypothetical protein [Dehalococcoidia bacterium]
MPPVTPVMLVRPPLGVLYDDGFWDEMEETGINEVTIQWLALLDDPSNHDSDGSTYPQLEDTNPRGLAAVGGAPVNRVPVPSYIPDHALYDGLAYQPPEMPSSVRGESEQLKDVMARASERGFRINLVDDKAYFLKGAFGTGGQEAAPFCVNDPELAGYAVARTRDTLANYPSLNGMILDGPDFKWEIKPGHRDELFIEECG